MNDHIRVAKAGWKSDSKAGSVLAIVVVAIVFLPVLRQLWGSYKTVRGVARG